MYLMFKSVNRLYMDTIFSTHNDTSLQCGACVLRAFQCIRNATSISCSRCHCCCCYCCSLNQTVHINFPNSRISSDSCLCACVSFASVSVRALVYQRHKMMFTILCVCVRFNLFVLKRTHHYFFLSFSYTKRAVSQSEFMYACRKAVQYLKQKNLCERQK